MSVINGTIIYRELGEPPEVLINWLDERQQLWNVVDDTGKEHLYVDNDQPRDADITPMLVEHTIGFSLFTEGGKRLGDFSRLDRVMRAQEKAVLTIVPEFELEAEMEDDEPVVTSDISLKLQARIAELEAELKDTLDAAVVPEEEADEED